MPYEWVEPTDKTIKAELHLWPYRSLPRRGFVWLMGMGFSLMLLPLVGLVGSIVLWWMLPFGLGAMGALWFFIEKSYKDGEILEELVIQRDRIHLTRHGPRGQHHEWEANPHWVTAQMHPNKGPVKHYITLKGNNREVELGAFLSEDERPILFKDVERVLMQAKSHQD